MFRVARSGSQMGPNDRGTREAQVTPKVNSGRLMRQHPKMLSSLLLLMSLS